MCGDTGWVTVTTLIISVCFLLYRYPAMPWSVLSGWLYPGKAPAADEGSGLDEGDPDAVAITKQQKIPIIEQCEGGNTPKAEPTSTANDLPTFSLTGQDGTEPVDVSKPEPLPTFPATNSAQRASPMAPPPKPAVQGAKSASAGPMPPPTRAPAVRRAPPPSAASSLRIPSTGPLPNRCLPANSQQRVMSGLSRNGAVSAPNPRDKVLLSPGHSPMDWAALTRSGNLAGVSTFQRVTPSELKKMTGRKGKPAWSTWQGKVYNITPYLPFHPGGEAELMKGAGRDGTELFMDVHPWVNWENMLGSCLVGVLVPENYGMGEGGSSLEDMD